MQLWLALTARSCQPGLPCLCRGRTLALRAQGSPRRAWLAGHCAAVWGSLSARCCPLSHRLLGSCSPRSDGLGFGGRSSAGSIALTCAVSPGQQPKGCSPCLSFPNCSRGEMGLAVPGSSGVPQPHHAGIGVRPCVGATLALRKVAHSALEEEQVLHGPAKRVEKLRLLCPSLPRCIHPHHPPEDGEAGKTRPARAEVTPNRRQTLTAPCLIW